MVLPGGTAASFFMILPIIPTFTSYIDLFTWVCLQKCAKRWVKGKTYTNIPKLVGSNRGGLEGFSLLLSSSFALEHRVVVNKRLKHIQNWTLSSKHQQKRIPTKEFVQRTNWRRRWRSASLWILPSQGSDQGRRWLAPCTSRATKAVPCFDVGDSCWCFKSFVLFSSFVCVCVCVKLCSKEWLTKWVRSN